MWPTKDLIFGHLVAGPLETNCYIVGCRQRQDGLVIDPGTMLDSEFRELEALIDDAGVRIRYIVNTHGHADHISGNRRLKSLTGAKVMIHGLDLTRLTDASLNGSRLFGTEITSPAADETLEHADQIVFGAHRLRVIHTPGHTPGSICLLGDGYVFTGDTLFSGSVGVIEQSDGISDELGLLDMEIDSIRKRLLVLPDETRIFPGHGPFSTIGRERRHNPFLA